MSAKIDRGHNE